MLITSFFPLILLLLKHALLSSNAFHNSLLPTECSWNKLSVPFPISVRHIHPSFSFLQVLQTDSQSPDNMSWTFSHHYLSMAYPVPISTSQDPTLFLRFNLTTEESRILGSPATPLLSFYTALSFNKHLVPYRVRCCGISLLLQSPWEQRLFHLYPTGRPRCAVAVFKCKIPIHSQRLSALKFTTWLSSPFQRIIPL